MRDFRDAKAMAHTLRGALAGIGFKISVGQSLELIAQSFGAGDWNTLSAAIRAQATGVPRAPPPPTTAEIPAIPAGPPKHLSAELEATLKQVFAYAKGRRHEELTV
jgi:hypothetical protein